MKRIKDRIAKSIVAGRQNAKTWFVKGETCDFHIEESSYLRDGEYTCSELEKDIDGFIEDVNREVSMFGLQCNRSNVRFGIFNGLLVFTYDQKAVVVGEDAMERIRTSEWIMEE